MGFGLVLLESMETPKMGSWEAGKNRLPTAVMREYDSSIVAQTQRANCERQIYSLYLVAKNIVTSTKQSPSLILRVTIGQGSCAELGIILFWNMSIHNRYLSINMRAPENAMHDELEQLQSQALGGSGQFQRVDSPPLRRRGSLIGTRHGQLDPLA